MSRLYDRWPEHERIPLLAHSSGMSTAGADTAEIRSSMRPAIIPHRRRNRTVHPRSLHCSSSTGFGLADWRLASGGCLSIYSCTLAM